MCCNIGVDMKKPSFLESNHNKEVRAFVVIHSEFGFYTSKPVYLNFSKNIEDAETFMTRENAEFLVRQLPAGLRIPVEIREMEKIFKLF